MMNTTHRIRKQSWIVKTASADDAFATRSELVNRWESDYLPIFEEAFNKFSIPGKVLHIPKLEIKVRRDESDPAKFREEILKQLLEQLSEVIPSPDSHGSYLQDEYETNMLLHYLQFGVLSWEGSHLDVNVLLAEMDFEKHLEQVIRHIRSESAGDAFLFRWLQLISVKNGKLELFASRIAPEEFDEEATTLLSEINQLLSEKVDEQSRLKFLCGIFREIAGKSETFLDALILQLDQQQAELKGVEESIRALPAFKLLTGSRKAEDSSPDSKNRENSESSENIQVQESADAVKVPGSGIMVPHAGMVLLHPFLLQLFRINNILEADSSFIPAERLSKAAAMLSYIAKGIDKPQEWELPLVKLLLGLHPTDHLMVFPDQLEAEEVHSCDEVLKAVLEYWTALKNTSSWGIREAFLSRSGLVKELDHSWKLTIESKSIDILLSKLPWSVSIVKLPWMDKPIFAEWPTP